MDLQRIEEKLDKAVAGAVAVSDSVGGVMFTSMAEVMEFAKLLSLAGTAVPKHLRGNPGGCLAITIQALEWRMSPIAVANKSYEVNDRIAYESQLIHAVIEARAPLKQRLRAVYSGDGVERACKVSGHLKGEVDPLEYDSPPISKIKVKNSPLWTADPDQQLWYYAVRAWARKYCPDVLLGIYSADELEDTEPEGPATPNLKDRLKGAKGQRGFSPENVAAIEHKPTLPVEAVLPTGRAKDEIAVARTESANAAAVEAKPDEAFTQAETTVTNMIGEFAAMPGEKEVDELAECAKEFVRGAEISDDERAILFGRIASGSSERKRALAKSKTKARAA